MASVKRLPRKAPPIDTIEGRLLHEYGVELANLSGGLAQAVEVIHAIRKEIAALRRRVDKIDPEGGAKSRTAVDRRRRLKRLA